MWCGDFTQFTVCICHMTKWSMRHLKHKTRPVTDCIRGKSCVIQTGKSEFKSLYRAGPTPISIKGSTIFNLPYIIRSGARQIFPGGQTDMPCNVTGLFRGGWNVKINEPFMEVGVGAVRYRDLNSDIPACILKLSYTADHEPIIKLLCWISLR